MSHSTSVTLDLRQSPADLTQALCNIESVSGNEKPIADIIEESVRKLAHLSVLRFGNTVVARTDLGRAQRVVLAGHLDTVPLSAAGNLPTWIEGSGPDQLIFGRGTCDMKSGVAVQLALAAQLAEPRSDLTFVFYDGEEVETERNGLGQISRTRPELVAADFAVLLEPTNAVVEGGCNGTMRVVVEAEGVAAHSARSWMGRNAIHAAGGILDILRAYQPSNIEVEGLVYREGLNAVGIAGGVANNVIPDQCAVIVNYRFAPSRTPVEAEKHMREVFAGYPVTVTDRAPGAKPGLSLPLVKEFAAVVGTDIGPKYGWTDVSLFSELGIAAVNFGPGDPMKAHADDEHVPVKQIDSCLAALARWLG